MICVRNPVLVGKTEEIMSNITQPQRNMKHARWKDIADSLCSINVSVGELLSKISHEVLPDWEIIKIIEKRLIKKLFDLDSTEKMSSKQIDIMNHYWEKGLGENWEIELKQPEDYGK